MSRAARPRAARPQVLLVVAMTAYLPISRVAVQVFACHPQLGRFLRLASDGLCARDPITMDRSNQQTIGYSCDCGRYHLYPAMVFGAIVVIGFYTLGFPLACAILIHRYHPRGHAKSPDKTFDTSGTLIDYTDELYQRDLLTNPVHTACPYLPLYAGYSRRWAYYRVFTMAMKACLIFFIVAGWRNTVVQCGLALSLLYVYGAVAMIARPAFSRMANFVELVGRCVPQQRSRIRVPPCMHGVTRTQARMLRLAAAVAAGDPDDLPQCGARLRHRHRGCERRCRRHRPRRGPV